MITQPSDAAAGSSSTPRQLRVGIAGFGDIGRGVAEKLLEGIPGFTLSAIGARNRKKVEERIGSPAPVLIVDIDQLEPHSDIVVECVPAALFCSVAEPVLRAGKKLIALSCGALLNTSHLLDLARDHGGQIIVPTGALLGLDAVTAAMEGRIEYVRMITRKPLASLAGAPFLEKNNIRLEDIKTPLKIFSGSARDAAIGFPANLNVGVALSLAGIGPDKTTLEIWADPTIDRNTHRIEVESDSARLSMEIGNLPGENQKTGRITPLSVVALLRKMTAPLRIGT